MHNNNEPERVRIFPSLLNSDKTNQREVDLGFVDKLAQHWDVNMCDDLIVNRRSDGSLYLLDGQHRLLAIQKLMGLEMLPADYKPYCRIIEISSSEEGKYIAERDKLKRKYSHLDKWGPRRSYDPKVKTIDLIVQKAGFIIANKRQIQNKRVIESAKAVESVYDKELNLLESTLAFIRAVWYDQPFSTNADIITGVACFLYCTQNNRFFEWDKVVACMANVPIQSVRQRRAIKKATTSVKPIHGVADSILEIYNETVGQGGRKLKYTRDW